MKGAILLTLDFRDAKALLEILETTSFGKLTTRKASVICEFLFELRCSVTEAK